MLYTNASWEKIHARLYKYEKKIISHRLSFFASSAPLIIGGVFILFAVVNTGSAYLNHALSFKSLQPVDLFFFIGVACSVWLISKGKVEKETSKEHGGIHPDDTLIILDGAAQTVMKQVGMTEEQVGTFANMQLNIRKDKSGKNVKYCIEAVFPQKRERIAITHNKARAEKLLQEIKTHLLIT